MKTDNIYSKKIALIAIVFISALNLLGKPNILVRNFPLIDQLPSNTVKRIFQDNDGYMWFGTLDGLCRYDGYRIITFRSDINNPDLLLENEISCLEEDHHNNIWIGTSRGINILNKKNYKITHFNNEYINNKEIRAIKVSRDGNIWVGIYGAILCFNPDFTLRKAYLNRESYTPNINSIYEDQDGNVWISLTNRGLHKYDKASDSFKKYPKIGERDNPFVVFQDDKKQFWVGTWGDGLYLFDPEQTESKMFTPINILNKEKKAKETAFFSIVQDDFSGYIWAISLSGLYALKRNEKNVVEEKNISYLFSNSNNIFSEIIKDKKGNLWIGTYSEGIININFDRPAIKSINLAPIKQLTGIKPNVTNIYKDKKGVIWFNQNRWGTCLYYPDGKIKMIKDLPGGDQINNFICISDFRSLPNEMWVSSHYSSKIYSLDQAKSNKEIKINYEVDLSDISPSSGSILKYYEDKNNNIWIVTSNGIFVKPFGKSIKPCIQTNETIYDITEDDKAQIWISSKNNGLIKLSTSDNFTNIAQIIYTKENSALTSNKITAICGVGNIIWIGTQEGYVISYDIESETFKDMSNSFKMIREGIYNIIKDNTGSIWISTNKRIVQYHPETGSIRNYSMTDGLMVNSFLRNSVYKDREGNLLYGGNGGISLLSPRTGMIGNNQNRRIFITDIKANNQSLLQRGNNTGIDLVKQQITLEANDKNIEIDFSSLNYSFSTKVRYAYKMLGVDDDWMYPEYNRQFAFYNQLSKGNHTFLVKATNEDGLWNKEITKLHIYKKPTFYETWWAYAIYLILILALTLRIFTRIRNRIKLKNELRIAQIDKEKSEELTQVKLRYFTNISHDFLTPLTIISCLVDDIEMTISKNMKQFDIMRSNVDRLKRLLQQILDFRKVESGNMKLKLNQGDLNKFIRESCYTHFELLMKKKNINLQFRSNKEMTPAYFDMDKIDKVLFNLLSNAYKYTPAGGNVIVEIIENIISNRRYAIISIKDTGIGISSEDQKNIFTRFYNNKTKYAAETNGIGLSLTKDLIQLHNGSIKVESELNKGTIFTVEIPIDRESYNEFDIENIDIPVKNHNIIDIMSIEYNTPISDSENKLKSKTLLLVEDNIELLVLMKNLLSQEFNIETAENGNSALEIIKNKDIDIIVSDVMMPQMDGLELCKTIKNDIESSHIPIILLTAKNSVDDRIECYNSGADGYISKPFELKLLKARINSFLENKKEKQQLFKANFRLDLTDLKTPSIDEQFLNNAISIIEEHIAESELDVNILAIKLNISKSTLYRKIKTLTDLSPSDFIRNIKLKRASIILKDRSVNISEVAYQCGFSDPKYFSHCFKNEFNMTPSEYQKIQQP